MPWERGRQETITSSVGCGGCMAGRARLESSRPEKVVTGAKASERRGERDLKQLVRAAAQRPGWLVRRAHGRLVAPRDAHMPPCKGIFSGAWESWDGEVS